MNLSLISELAQRAGFLDLFLVACVVLYVATRVIRQDWEHARANELRNAIAWLLYVFAVALLLVSLSRIPGCEKARNQPQVQQNQVPKAPIQPDG